MKELMFNIAREVGGCVVATLMLLALTVVAVVLYFGGFGVGAALVGFGAPSLVGVVVGCLWALGVHLGLLRIGAI